MEKKIPHYVNDPIINRLTAPENKLYRPKINFFKAGVIFLGVITGTLLLSWGISFFLKSRDIFGFEKIGQGKAFIITYLIIQTIIFILTLKYILIWFVRIYQRYAKSETRLRCCYTPSCSEYAILALKKYGAILGTIKTINRLKRCGYPGGVDYP